jgi:hypothetical protein
MLPDSIVRDPFTALAAGEQVVGASGRAERSALMTIARW